MPQHEAKIFKTPWGHSPHTTWAWCQSWLGNLGSNYIISGVHIQMSHILSCHIPSARLTSTEAATKRQAVMAEIQDTYPDYPKEARVWFEQLLVHYNDVVLPKDDWGKDCNEALVLLQQMMGTFAAQVWVFYDVDEQSINCGCCRLWPSVPTIRLELQWLAS